MNLSVIIPTKNDEKNSMLATALDRMKDLPVEIIVVDWGSETPVELPRYVRGLYVPPAIANRINRDSYMAMAIAWNAGIRRASHEYVCATGNDSYCDESFVDWVARGQDKGAFHFISRKHTDDGKVVRISRNYGAGGAYFAHRDVWEALRGFDEKYIYYGWFDREVAERAMLAGYSINLAYDVSIWHFRHDRYGMRKAGMINEKVFPKETLIPESAVVNDYNWGVWNEPIETT
jgi:hypothetical protein